MPILMSVLGVKKIEKVATIMNLPFRNRLGLAAGFDKNADYLEVCDALGFGFVEIGTVTPKGQDGNPKPRLFRLPKDHGLINRMGFNNLGVQYMVEKLGSFRTEFPDTKMLIGGNIGKNKLTPNEKAFEDYVICYKALYPFVDYFVINVSSPNTPNLRELQDKKPLMEIFAKISEARNEMAQIHPNIKTRPILVKISPDNANQTVTDIVELVDTYKLAGVVVSNTTVSRENLMTNSNEVENIGNGGLSGRPVKNRCDELIKYVRKLAPDIVIIGVGGVETTKDAMAKQEAGADLVQIYTGFIYAGPKLIADGAKALD